MTSHSPRRSIRALALVLIAATLTGGSVGFLFWTRKLFSELDRSSIHRILHDPPRYLADVRLLRLGDSLSPDQLRQWLVDRGYAGSSGRPEKPGLYRQNVEHGLDVFFRPTVFPNGQFTSGRHRFSFHRGRLDKIFRESDQSECESVWLEPVVLDAGAKDDTPNPWVFLDRLPSTLKSAVILSEDRRFERHFGIDPPAFLRALTVNVRRGEVRQGGSTLSQQLVKNLFLSHERSLRRKIVEAFLALALEARYSKNAVLEMYLNHVYLGQGASRGFYGVEDASRGYFGKPAADMTVGECALLVGLIPAPNTNHPWYSPDNARRRRNHILGLLVHEGVLGYDQWRTSLLEPIPIAPRPTQGVGDYYLAWVRQILEERLPARLMDTQGYSVYLSMEIELQRAAERALARQPMEGALVALDPHTGHVKALVGGRGFTVSPFNRAAFAYRQPGSAFKPILYAAALKTRSMTLATLLHDEPLRIVQNNKVWEPKNYDGQFRGTVTVREALVYSLNVPSVELMGRIGTSAVIQLAESLGIKSKLLPVPSLALGTSEVTPLELTAAYAAFANGGWSVKPDGVLWVTDDTDRVVWEPSSRRIRALSPETAALVTDVLQDVLEHGTGRSARALGFDAPAAGKTGTSDNFMDAWFVGYTPELLCGVWLGHDQPASLGQASSRLALPVWVEFMKQATGPRPYPDFSENPGLVKVEIDPTSGKKARSGCPERLEELFLPATEPASFCDQHAGGTGDFFQRLWKKMRGRN